MNRQRLLIDITILLLTIGILLTAFNIASGYEAPGSVFLFLFICLSVVICGFLLWLLLAFINFMVADLIEKWRKR